MAKKTLSTLVEDIYELLDKGKANPELVEEFSNGLAKIVGDRLVDAHRPRSSKHKLRLSQIGKPCHKQIWYEYHDQPREPFTPATKLKFMFGDIIEALLLYLAKEAGHSVVMEQAEVSVGGIKGHIDAIIDDEVVDVKSTSKYGFQKFVDGRADFEDPFGYNGQISCYKDAFGKEEGHFLVMGKESGKLHLHTPQVYHDTDELVAEVKEVVAKDTPPPREFQSVPDGKSGNMKLGIECSYCPFKHSCWPNMRTFIYSAGPRFLVNVQRLPNVPEVKSQ